jgi:hypothetical protein
MTITSILALFTKLDVELLVPCLPKGISKENNKVPVHTRNPTVIPTSNDCAEPSEALQLSMVSEIQVTEGEADAPNLIDFCRVASEAVSTSYGSSIPPKLSPATRTID